MQNHKVAVSHDTLTYIYKCKINIVLFLVVEQRNNFLQITLIILMIKAAVLDMVRFVYSHTNISIKFHLKSLWNNNMPEPDLQPFCTIYV